MTRQDAILDAAIDLVQECRKADVDRACVTDAVIWLDQSARQIDAATQSWRDAVTVCAETAAWLRLVAGLLRGEDVPESIHILAGEDPADTARWQKWRA